MSYPYTWKIAENDLKNAKQQTLLDRSSARCNRDYLFSLFWWLFLFSNLYVCSISLYAIIYISNFTWLGNHSQSPSFLSLIKLYNVLTFSTRHFNNFLLPPIDYTSDQHYATWYISTLFNVSPTSHFSWTKIYFYIFHVNVHILFVTRVTLPTFCL